MPSSSGPLAGLVVVDLTRVLSGPYCTMMLADLGARVIKVERPGIGDDARHIGPFVETGSSTNRSAYFASVNRGKESIALDLKAVDHRSVFDRLLDRADVVVENYRPGALARLGYGFDDLHARWPRLVLTSVSGFGQTGPDSHRPAYDMIVQALGGVMSITGPEGGAPTRVGTSIGDITAGMLAAFGTLAALRDRDMQGLGSHVDVAMLDAQVALLENALARYSTTGVVPGPIGSRHPSITPFGAYRARDGEVVIAAGNDDLFRRLCAELGRPDLAADARFCTNADRCEHHGALATQIEAALDADTVDGWVARLSTAGLPCSPVRDVAMVVADPQVRARNMIRSLDDPTWGSLLVAGNPVKLGVDDDGPMPPPPELDQDRSAIMRWLDGIG